jgi:translation initiation factor IF-2
VVAADEGVMPQTLDALAAITEAKIPYIVAITKIDKNNADIERAKNSMLEKGIYLEGLGGDIAYAPISSKSGEGIPELLDLVLLAADLIELTADPEASAIGFVLESTQDPKRGASATLIVKDGTLKLSSFVVAGDAYAPVRFIENFLGARVEVAGPSEPARVSGFSSLPAAGSLFSVVKSKKEAEALAKTNSASTQTPVAGAATASGAIELPLIVKTDVAGSIDAIVHELAKITHERATIRVVASGVGSVSENDVKTATATGGTIIAFNASTDSIARDLAERDHVSILPFTIIYELSEAVTNLLAERAPSITIEKELGRAAVVKPFSSSAKKQVLGARHVSGVLTVGDRVKILRNGEEIGRGSIANLQQQRADVQEIKTEGTFGTEIEAKVDAAPNDEIVAFVPQQS